MPCDSISISICIQFHIEPTNETFKKKIPKIKIFRLDITLHESKKFRYERRIEDLSDVICFKTCFGRWKHLIFSFGRPKQMRLILDVNNG